MKAGPSSPPGYVTGPLKWAIALTAALGAILEVIDLSIVNVALNDIQANLGATVSEVGWVITSYGIANAVLIPLSAWLGYRFGKKNYFVFSMIGFTAASLLCGFSTSLGMLIFARILQGLFGGGLLAKAQAILFETFPPAEQGLAQAIFGISVIIGPALGPTLGGYLTDTLGWRWIFFINLPIGIVAVAMALLFLRPDEAGHLRPRSKVDWWGILLLILTVGSLQILLEEGQSEDWFDSRFIQWLAVLSGISFVLFIWRELTTEAPAVDLRVLKHRALAAGCLYSGILGMGLTGAIFALPLFTQSVLEFSATETGWLLAPGTIASAFVMLSLGKLTSKVDARLLVGAGAVGTSLTMLSLARITPQTGTDELFWPLIWRGLASVLMFLPLSLAALGGLPKDAIAAGSGLYNLMRQMGGSIGIAIMTTLLQQREGFHRAVVLAKLTPYAAPTGNRLSQFTALFHRQGYDAVTAHKQAIGLLGRTAAVQIAVLSYADLFRFIAALFFVSLPLLWFLGKGGKGRDVPAAH